MLEYEVNIDVPVSRLRAVLEKYVSHAEQPPSALVELLLPDGKSFGLPDDGITRAVSDEAKAVGILGSATALLMIPIDDVMRQQLPDVDQRTVSTSDAVLVKLPVRCGVLVSQDIARLSLSSTTSPQNRVLVESPSCREIYLELLATGGPGSRAYLVRETEWEPFPKEGTPPT